MRFKCQIRKLSNLQKTMDRILKELTQKIKKSIKTKKN